MHGTAESAAAAAHAAPYQLNSQYKAFVFSNPSHSSDIKARAAMDGGAPLG
jgi:hypothetical protein